MTKETHYDMVSIFLNTHNIYHIACGVRYHFSVVSQKTDLCPRGGPFESAVNWIIPQGYQRDKVLIIHEVHTVQSPYNTQQ